MKGSWFANAHLHGNLLPLQRTHSVQLPLNLHSAIIIIENACQNVTKLINIKKQRNENIIKIETVL